MASQKSMSLALELRDRLARRTTLAIGSVNLDTDGGVFFTVGPGTAGSQSMVIKSKEVVPLGFDGIGLQARGYAQTVIQCVLETSTIANVALMTEVNKLDLLGETLRQAARVELYMTANTTAPSIAGIIPGNLRSTWNPDLQYRLMDSQ